MTFQEIYETRPDKKDIGSSGYSRLKNLYDLCIKIKPNIIIESGTWKGNSSYLFSKTCPNSLIFCFDINLSNLMWESDNILYFENDIEDSIIPKHLDTLDKEKTLLFFDDHISQKRRLEWAINLGFKHLVFDDNVSKEEADMIKAPASPTLKMIDFPNNYNHKKYEILPFLGNEKKDTYLTYIEF